MFPTAETEDISQGTSLNRNSGQSRNARDSPEPTQVPKRSFSREITLNMLIKEMVFCIALALTTYGALHNSPTKISKQPQARKFFSSNSIVKDWYKGQLSDAMAYIENADVAFVMYYAPWDAESQYVRDEMDKAASVMGDRVHFAAINCWNPGSECRLQHSKIPSWPILMAYTINSRGVLYKGPREAHHIVRFLELVVKPIEKMSLMDDVVTKLASCDAAAVAFIPMIKNGSRYYHTWYQVALKMKEYDVHGELCFCVVTSEGLARSIGATYFPSVRLLLWNDTKEYKPSEMCQKEWNETSIMSWLLENFDTPAARVVPMWRKAYSFEKYVDGNPILILFTPLNPLYEEIPNYMLLREVAMEYYMYCRNNGTVKSREQSLLWTSEQIGVIKVQRFLSPKRGYDEFCEDSKQRLKPQKPKYYKKDELPQNNKWRNTTQKQKSAVENPLLKKGLNPPKIIEGAEDQSSILASVSIAQPCDPTTLPKSEIDNFGLCQSDGDNLLVVDSAFVHDSAFMHTTTFFNKETSMLPLEDDPLSAEGLVHDQASHFCKVFNFAKQWGPPIHPASVNEENLDNVVGYSCKKNFTLNMIAVDSVENHHFAESLGIDIKNMRDMTSVVILDTKHETQYVMKETYSAKSLRSFIRDFTHKRLKRSLRTHVSDASHTHYFSADATRTERVASHNHSFVSVTDLTTKTFRKFVRTPGMVSIVAVCGGACGAHTTRALLDATRLLRDCGVRAQPARVDALRHDLPWHYTAASYPAILVFFKRKDGSEPDSRAYPLGARVSACGLVALALHSLGTPQHLRVRLVLCNHSQTIREKKTCLRELKEQIETIIGRNLKYWRRTDDRQLKDAFLKRLQHLHQLSLDMSLLHVTDLSDSSPKQTSILEWLSTLTKHWDINVGVLKNLSRLR